MCFFQLPITLILVMCSVSTVASPGNSKSVGTLSIRLS